MSSKLRKGAKRHTPYGLARGFYPNIRRFLLFAFLRERRFMAHQAIAWGTAQHKSAHKIPNSKPGKKSIIAKKSHSGKLL
jgi:hypothetical protein